MRETCEKSGDREICGGSAVECGGIHWKYVVTGGNVVE